MKKTLIVIDMQNDFIDGSLGTDEAVKIVSNVRKKIEEYRSNGDEIIFTRDTHGEDYLNTPEGKKLPVVHCVKNPHGWQIADGLDVPDAIHIDKPSFGYTHWDKFCFERIEGGYINMRYTCIFTFRFSFGPACNLQTLKTIF